MDRLRQVVKVGSIRVGEGKAFLTGNRFDIASCDFLKAFQHNKTPLKIISTIILNGLYHKMRTDTTRHRRFVTKNKRVAANVRKKGTVQQENP